MKKICLIALGACSVFLAFVSKRNSRRRKSADRLSSDRLCGNGAFLILKHFV